jgi:hypothetical protein
MKGSQEGSKSNAQKCQSKAPNTSRKPDMTRFKMLSAATMLSAMMTTSVFAQAAIQEPGSFAFVHPNADVLNAGAPTPAGAMASLRLNSSSYAAREIAAGSRSCTQRHRSYQAKPSMFHGCDGRRHQSE